MSLVLTSCNKSSTISPYSNTDTVQAEPTVKNEESWSEWTSRQWNDKRIKYTLNTLGVAIFATSCFFVYNKFFKNPKSSKTPKVETPKVETPKVETPKVETPKVETDPNT